MTFNKDIVYALAAFAAGVVITLYSYTLISMIADPYLMPYVYSNPMNEAVSSIDRFLARVNIVDTIAMLIGVAFLALAAYFASCYVSRTASKTRRIAAIVFATVAACQGAMTVLMWSMP